MEECIFCKIVNHEISANIIYEDDDSLAFLDIKPVSRGHALVIPKKHSADLMTIPAEDLMNLTKTMQKIAHAVVKATGAEGINVTTNNGAAAGQIIFHLHYHLIPRFQSDGLKQWPHHESEPKTRAELAEEIKKYL